MNDSPFRHAETLHIGTVDFVSPDEIKVLLDIDAPESVALNAGDPRLFPRVNSYMLMTVDDGFVVGQVEWITVERSAFPKRRGMQDFGLIDLPYPLRKMSLNPLGILRQTSGETYRFCRGSDALPTIGSGVFLPTENQLRSIVESGERRRVKIGTSPLANGAEVRIDPDRLFGRHLAVLGNTGSGKSCSVAGLIRWSIEQAQKESGRRPNARFIVLDPNGEYARAFKNTMGSKTSIPTRIFKVTPEDGEDLLQVPLWFWTSAEWCSFTHATERAQRPVLQQALRLRRNRKPAGLADNSEEELLFYLQGAFSTIAQQISNNAPFSTSQEGKYWNFIEILEAMSSSLGTFQQKSEKINSIVEPLAECINRLCTVNCKNKRGYNKPFEYADVEELKGLVSSLLDSMGGNTESDIPIGEDTPIPFSAGDFLVDLNFLAASSGNRQWLDFFITRVRTLLSDTRMRSIVDDSQGASLSQWLENYIGGNEAANGCLTIVDLSLVPSEVVHIITAVIARIVFESLQRFRKLDKEHRVLPTALVMEEAHTFIKRYKDEFENNDAAKFCCQVFERIAREGRKFGLGLVLSSQRPSELSPTVLAQCNTFLLHRISNDRDQELVHRLVPDNLRGLLRELPSLPSQNAILLGWASELPVLVKMNDLPKSQQPQSDDPDFWDVWTGKDKNDNVVERKVDWQAIADDWQGKPNNYVTAANGETDEDKEGG